MVELGFGYQDIFVSVSVRVRPWCAEVGQRFTYVLHDQFSRCSQNETIIYSYASKSSSQCPFAEEATVGLRELSGAVISIRRF